MREVPRPRPGLTFDFVLETPPLPPAGGPVKRRLAVRAVVFREGRLLLVHSRAVGDWKFPGGGVEALETPERALAREVCEETGYGFRKPVRLVGRFVERAAGRDLPGGLFEMESLYYRVSVTGAPGSTDLDDYERELGFEARWVTVDQALQDNRTLAASGRGDLPPWLTRETRVLEWLASIGPNGPTGA
ncbi:MAG TPA: NUDIX domain-containing protein [Spirochaetia bacterium]|nr:NUDIX domain-containing protein [Spirochaetia bacterium]